MSVLDRLAACSGVFWGEGSATGHGPLAVRVAVQAHTDRSVTLEYEAWTPGRGLHHAEVARMYRSAGRVLLVATSDGSSDALTFREGDTGVFGSSGPHRVGLVLEVEPPDGMTLAWWWPGEDGALRQQSCARVRRSRPLVAPPPGPPGGDGEAPRARTAAPDATADPPVPADGAAEATGVPWPGILVLDGPGTGVVAHRLAERLSRAAVIRTDLFDKAVLGNRATADPGLRERVAVAAVRAYAETGHPVILHGRGPSSEQRRLVDALRAAGLTPVRLVEVAEGENYGEVARRLIQDD